MSTADCKFRIPLMMYIKMQHEDCSIDCCDTEIDAMICVESEIYSNPEFPLLEQCTRKLYELIDVVRIGDPVTVDIAGLLHHNIDVIRPWVKENWKPEYVDLIDTDDGEWEYQLIASFERIISGNAGEKTAECYIKLLSQFERVPAQPNEYVIVPQHDVALMPQKEVTK